MNTTPAKRTAERFLHAVMAGDWPEAARNAQVQWVRGTPPGTPDAEYLHAFMEPLKEQAGTVSVGMAHRVRLRPHPPSECMCDVDFTIESGDAILSGRCRVIREDERGRPSESRGRWGVNPQSVYLRLKRAEAQEA